MPSAPIHNTDDKQRLRKELIRLCEQSWISSGYKKTNIKELCKNAQISVGTFYSLYPTKEHLFCTALKNIHKNFTNQFVRTLAANPSKEHFSKSIKNLLREYDQKPFLYDRNSADFQAFISKLPEAERAELKFDSLTFFNHIISNASLTLKIDKEKAFGVFSALLATIHAKETFLTTDDYFAAFDFMVDNLIPQIFI